MQHLPQLMADLALLLTVAAIATVACRRLKQPLVLGYVIAGFLISPSIGWFPGVSDTESVTTWSEIGVVFLMFGLGLEFSIVRLSTVGKSAFVTALTEMVLMVVAGFACGMALGWSFFTSVFLGGMLAISSTTIIIKAFDDLGMKGKGFTELVFGALVVEDIMGIFLMVVLATTSVGSNTDGGAVVVELAQMALYLLVWFALSVILVPTLLSRISPTLTDEILLIASVALCLCMVELASGIGFSSALGAFLAGSILAGTIQAHRIEKLFKPLKDLFGAVFFVSVGMMLSPSSIVENVGAIIAITVVVLIGKPVFTFLGAFLSGESLKTSINCGMSLSQIGEFSFIIASLGVSLGVTASNLYPIIVAVSVITTLTTPFYVKNSDRLYRLCVRLLPQSALDRLKKRVEEDSDEKQTNAGLWSSCLKRWALKIGLVAFAGIASVEILANIAMPFLERFIPQGILGWGIMALCVLITGLFISNCFHFEHGDDFSILWIQRRRNHIWLSLLVLGAALVSIAVVIYIAYASDIRNTILPYVLALLSTVVLARSKVTNSWFLKLETSFIGGLNENILAERRENLNDEEHINWVERHLFVTEVEASRIRLRVVTPVVRALRYVQSGGEPPVLQVERSPDFLYGIAHGLDLLAIERDGQRIAGSAISRLDKGELLKRISDPDDPLCIREGDKLTFLGTEDEVDSYLQSLMKEDMVDEGDVVSVSLEKYLTHHPSALDAICFSFEIDPDAPFVGKTIADADFKGNYGSIVVAIEHKWVIRMRPPANVRIEAGDRLWLVGMSELAGVLVKKADAYVIDQRAPEDATTTWAGSVDGGSQYENTATSEMSLAKKVASTHFTTGELFPKSTATEIMSDVAEGEALLGNKVTVLADAWGNDTPMRENAEQTSTADADKIGDAAVDDVEAVSGDDTADATVEDTVGDTAKNDIVENSDSDSEAVASEPVANVASESKDIKEILSADNRRRGRRQRCSNRQQHRRLYRR